MAKFCPLFSGSDGNATYISHRGNGLLIDAGSSYKALIEALDRVGESIDEIKAVAVTHEHSDHVKGLHTLLNKNDIPLIASKQTADALITSGKVPPKTKIIIADGDIDINGLCIKRFATSHDCEGSSGYSVLLPEGKKLTLCTDLGVITDQVREAISESDLILLESNHDIDMLKKGPYPPQLKLRILSDKGHISNNACAAELKILLEGGTTRFILGHLSRNNNIPMLAKKTAEAALIDLNAENGRDYILTVAAPEGNGVTVI